jgi:integrase
MRDQLTKHLTDRAPAKQRKHLTDRALKALKPAPAGERYVVMDSHVPGMGIRVTENGVKTFVLITRYPGHRSPARRALGVYEALTLEAARDKARAWIELVHKGIDPAVVEEQAKAEALRKQENSFCVVVEDWLQAKVAKERQAKDVERDFRREFLPVWGALPITAITDLHVLTIVNTKKRTAPAQARNLLAHLKRFFSWAIDQRVYGLTASPCDRLRPTKIIGKKKRRNRTLNDDELFALWRAANRLPYPSGSVYQLLMLTALRLTEASAARRPEINRRERTWTIPEERMKGKNDEARAHVVPFTADIAAVFDTLPEFKGPYLFSHTFGKKPVAMSSFTKRWIDKRMLLTLRALARRRGDDPAAVEFKPWVNHDIRRTVRTRLSRLKIAEEIKEAVLGHARPDNQQTYDIHDFLNEKREALELWAAQLRSIVAPSNTPDNVVTLRA